MTFYDPISKMSLKEMQAHLSRAGMPTDLSGRTITYCRDDIKITLTRSRKIFLRIKDEKLYPNIFTSMRFPADRPFESYFWLYRLIEAVAGHSRQPYPSLPGYDPGVPYFFCAIYAIRYKRNLSFLHLYKDKHYPLAGIEDRILKASKASNLNRFWEHAFKMTTTETTWGRRPAGEVLEARYAIITELARKHGFAEQDIKRNLQSLRRSLLIAEQLL